MTPTEAQAAPGSEATRPGEPGRADSAESRPRVALLPPNTAAASASREGGPRVVGMPAHDRNRRVALRAGLALVSAEELSTVAPGTAVLAVPAEATIQVGLFDALPDPGELWRITGPSGGAAGEPDGAPTLLWGPAAEVAEALRGGRADAEPRRARAVPADLLFDLSTAPARREAQKRLLKQAGKATDGFVSRHLNRRISRPLSDLFLRWGLRPGHASLMNLAVGLGSAVFVALDGWLTLVVAGFLFQMASALDGVDGEMARVTLRESPRGALIDTAVDNGTYLACLVGLVVGWVREGVGPAGVSLAVVVLLGAPALLLTLMRFVRRYGPDGSMVFVDRCVAHAAEREGGLSLRVVRWTFLAFRRDVFAMLFFLVAFSGRRVALVGAVAVGLLLAAGLLAWNRHRLVESARALAASVSGRPARARSAETATSLELN